VNAELGWAAFLLLGATAFFAAVLGGLSGFGAGLILTPALLPVVGVKGLVPVLSVAMIFGNLSRVWVYRAHLQPALVLRVLLPALPGVALGSLLYGWLPQAPLAVLIGLFLLVSIPLRRMLARKQVVPTPRAVLGFGFLFGLVAGAMPGGGVIVVPLLLGLGLAGGALVGTDAVIGAGVNLFKVALFGGMQLLSWDLVLGGLLVGLCMIPGTYAARWLMERIALRIHVVLMEVLVALSGLAFVWGALQPG
jgi:uncharacterized membrane protein YfcA